MIMKLCKALTCLTCLFQEQMMGRQTTGRQEIADRQVVVGRQVVDLGLISFPVLIPICYPLIHLLETVYLIGMYGVMIISKVLALHPRQ